MELEWKDAIEVEKGDYYLCRPKGGGLISIYRSEGHFFHVNPELEYAGPSTIKELKEKVEAL